MYRAVSFWVIILVLASAGCIGESKTPEIPEPFEPTVHNFEECMEAGYPVMESYPRQCKSPDGQIFVEELDEATNTAPINPPQTIIAIFADGFTYNQLEHEINRYADDIERDLNSTVIIYNGTWQSPHEIRDTLIKLKNRNLSGTVLIGDIPYVYFESKEGFAFAPSLTELVTDIYYGDLESDMFVDADNNGKFESGNYSLYDNPMKIIWVGRIKPPVNGSEGISLLKTYFERNHEYRTGEITPLDKMMLIQRDEESIDRNVDHYRYESGKYIDTLSGIIPLPNPTREEYLQALKTGYETVVINTHGDWHSQTVKDGDIRYQDIQDIKPKPYFYYLLSCANGDFGKENYLGGNFLFSGNGLVVYALTFPTLMGGTDASHIIRPLSYGQTFGEAVMEGAYPYAVLSTILGDPTLRIRPKRGIAKLEISRTEIDFGEVSAGGYEPANRSRAAAEAVKRPATASITIKNTGNQLAIIDSWYYHMETDDGTQGSGAIGYSDEIPPGENRKIEFEFTPPVVGEYEGTAVITTNDPFNPITIIRLRGRGV